jgi:hypothetical protein
MGTLREDMERQPTRDLMTGLLSDVKEIAMGQVGRMQGEIKDEFKNLRSMMVKIGAGVGFAVLAGILIAHTLAAVLVALGLPWWAGYLIASAVLLGIGALFLARLPDDRQNADLYPEESVAKMKGDIQDMRHAVQSST